MTINLNTIYKQPFAHTSYTMYAIINNKNYEFTLFTSDDYFSYSCTFVINGTRVLIISDVGHITIYDRKFHYTDCDKNIYKETHAILRILKMFKKLFSNIPCWNTVIKTSLETLRYLAKKSRYVMYMVKDTETQGNKYTDYVTGTYWECFKAKSEALEYMHKHQDELLLIVGFTQEDMDIIENM